MKRHCVAQGSKQYGAVVFRSEKMEAKKKILETKQAFKKIKTKTPPTATHEGSYQDVCFCS